MYDVTSYRSLRSINVPNACKLTDMTSCEHNRCVYISDHYIESVHRLDSHGAATRWAVNDKPWSLSVNASHNVLVTCPLVRKIKEFSTDGRTIREVQLPSDVINPSHTIQLVSDGQFLVCHGLGGDTACRVCIVSADGSRTVRSYSGQPGPDTGRPHVPRRLAVDNYGFVFVADVSNRQITLLSPTLDYIRPIVTSNLLKGDPRRLCLDVQRGHLYVADTEYKVDDIVSGRVMVVSV